MRRQLSFMKNNGYPYYLHNNESFIQYWKKYFEEYPLSDNDRFEIYIDFPFCRSICKFCVFGSCTIGEYKDQIKNYTDSLVSLISDMKDVFPHRINNVYFGGGTPSLWPREELLKIINNIPEYHNACTRTIEAHPIDLTDDWLDFVINDLNIKTVSIGVQSFDLKSNKDQNRIPVDINKVKHAVEVLHNHGRYVNIDIVALFNEDSEHGWNTFQDDLEIAYDIHPDDICSSPNFRVSNYYDKSIRYRKILVDFLNEHPDYVIEHESSLSMNIDDVIDFGEEPYHLRIHEYHKFFNSCRVGILDTRANVVNENIIMAFGGSNGHNGVSMAGKKLERIYSYFNFDRNKLIHEVRDITVSSEYKHGDKVPIVRIGNCNIDTNIMKG